MQRKVCMILFTTYVCTADADVLNDSGLYKGIYELYHVNETVSLDPYTYRIGMGAVYTEDMHHISGIHEYHRQVNTQANIAYGIHKHVELSLSVPVGWKYRIEESAFDTRTDHTIGGFEQVVARVIGSTMIAGCEVNNILAIQVPTEHSVRLEEGILSTYEINLAHDFGHVFMYGGVSWQRAWKHESNTFGVTGGVGYYVSNTLALGVQVSDVPALNPKLGAVRDIAAASVHLAYQITPTIGLVPAVGLGMSENAPEISVDMNLYWKIE